MIIATISSAGSELEGMKPRSHDLVDNFVSVQLAVHKLDMLIAKKKPQQSSPVSNGVTKLVSLKMEL